jgi:hypothetical protein
MATSSGSLGGDDSSKLDALTDSIQQNSDKLDALTRILGKISDAGGTQGGGGKSGGEGILDKIQKVLSPEDTEKAGAKALSKQGDLDKLAANNFRASETIISELLSRFGGTSFYPVLSAFRVARESAAVGTGKSQDQLGVMDMFKFVNNASRDLLTGNVSKNLPDVEGISKEQMIAAKTAAGIAGLGSSILLIANSAQKFSQATSQFVANVGALAFSAVTNAQGMTQGTQALSPVKPATEMLTAGASTAGAAIGTIIYGPLGGIIGSTIGTVIGSTVGAPLNMAVDVLTAIENGVSQIANDLVGFSPEVTFAVIERELSILNDDMRRSNQIGDEVSRIFQAQTRLQLETRRAFDNLVELAEPLLVSGINLLTVIVSNLSEFIKQNANTFTSFLIGLLDPTYGMMFDFIKDIADGVNVLAESTKETSMFNTDLLSSIANTPDFARMNPGAMVSLAPAKP